MSREVIIIGAGPAGLTAAYELLHKSDLIPVIIEKSSMIGGLSRTVNYKGNLIDIGGHRFYSKSPGVIKWWQNILPVQGAPSIDDRILGRKCSFSNDPLAPDPEKTDKVMLLRRRLSRIFFLGKFFDYPVSLNMNTFMSLGLLKIIKIILSYLQAMVFPIRAEKTLEDFFINRFGKELYSTFFRDYTHKVWGVHCSKIKPEWGIQRIKGMSISKAVAHSLRKFFCMKDQALQGEEETSLVEQFLYPKLGPGQMWEEVAGIIRERGGKILLSHAVTALHSDGNKIHTIEAIDNVTGATIRMHGEYVVSTMPVKELIQSLGDEVPKDVQYVANGLQYRDFITVGLLLKRLKLTNRTSIKTINNIVPDNWLYIQEPDVKLGRIQIFNNWSPYLVRDKDTVWIGLEYFCTEGDETWIKSDEELTDFVIEEASRIGVIDIGDVTDSVVIRELKAYPAYFGTYCMFDKVISYTKRISNLYLIGRNGMHRYNNQDHSMLTAMMAVENIIENKESKDGIWAVNIEQEYHEQNSG